MNEEQLRYKLINRYEADNFRKSTSELEAIAEAHRLKKEIQTVGISSIFAVLISVFAPLLVAFHAKPTGSLRQEKNHEQ
jgi:hypothetical protein